ncbi:hypothetical protein Axi01nite_20070 [Actinoplanes xinjiangensis]|nr:hypothetical protein Axi01nite_20070 [Actinoplanes xinjiangensis]
MAWDGGGDDALAHLRLETGEHVDTGERVAGIRHAMVHGAIPSPGEDTPTADGAGPTTRTITLSTKRAPNAIFKTDIEACLVRSCRFGSNL